MTTYTTRTLRRHTVRGHHAVTGRPVAGLTAELVGAPWWWTTTRVPGGIAVVAPGPPQLDGVDQRARPEPVQPPRVRLRVADPAAARMLDAPEVELVLDADELAHAFVPVPQTLTLVLLDRQGQPRTGRTVRAVPGSGPEIALDAVSGEPGSYRTDSRTWTASESPFDLRVNGTSAGRFRIDPDRLDTRLQLVTPA